MGARTHRRIGVLGVVLVAVLGVATPAAVGAEASEPVGADHWIVVDADSGAVLAEHDARTRTLPASTIKLFTALLAVGRLEPDQPVTISPLAASMPARRMGMAAGERWTRDDLVHAALIASANDAAVALAEAVGGGSLVEYGVLAQEVGTRLGLEDEPFLADPSGLDDEQSFLGGSLISARDLAIVARAVLAHPELAPILSLDRYDMTALDGQGHYVLAHNRLLDRYPGAIGMKTGGTKAAGSTFVAAGQREGRTIIAVLFRTPNLYAEAATLLDLGFASASVPTPGGDVLPPVDLGAVADVIDGAAAAQGPGDGPAGTAWPRRLLGGDLWVWALPASFGLYVIVRARARGAVPDHPTVAPVADRPKTPVG